MGAWFVQFDRLTRRPGQSRPKHKRYTVPSQNATSIFRKSSHGT